MNENKLYATNGNLGKFTGPFQLHQIFITVMYILAAQCNSLWFKIKKSAVNIIIR